MFSHYWLWFLPFRAQHLGLEELES
jgi:hypothetical protein